jgi:hypothetical protein
MHIITSLICFGIRQVIGVNVKNVAEYVEQYYTDHSATLPKALAKANNKTWRALGIALAGDGLLDRAN